MLSLLLKVGIPIFNSLVELLFVSFSKSSLIDTTIISVVKLHCRSLMILVYRKPYLTFGTARLKLGSLAKASTTEKMISKAGIVLRKVPWERVSQGGREGVVLLEYRGVYSHIRH